MVITIKDIAKIAGVSHSTVSRALNGHAAIPVETANRIKKIASDLGYVPSVVARGLKTNRSQALGVIVTRIDDPFFSEILQGIEDVFQEIGYSLFIAASNHDFNREKTIAQTMLQHRVEGLIICSTQFGDEHYFLLKQYGLPIVAIGNHEVTDCQYMVYHDDFYGICQVTQYLIEIGHQKIAFLGNARAPRTTQGRLNGFYHEMKVANLPVSNGFIFHSPNDQLEGGEFNAKHFLDLSEQPTAIVCFNDMMAIGVIKALRNAGVQIPRDCSITGFDGISFAEYTYPPLTTFEQPKYQLGYDAAKMMHNLLQSRVNSSSTQEPVLMLRGRLIVRESTSPIVN